jgi:hypothetical protein
MPYERRYSSSIVLGSALQASRVAVRSFLGDTAWIALQGLELRSFIVAPES